MTNAIPLDHLRCVLSIRRVQPAMRTCAYTAHPYTGADCRTPGRWRTHGGALFSPWCAGYIENLVDLVKRRGRSEVLRTWGVGIRQLKAELCGAWGRK